MDRGISKESIKKIKPYEKDIYDLYWKHKLSFKDISEWLGICSPSTLYRYMKKYFKVRTHEEQLIDLKESNTGRIWTEETKENVRQGVIRSYKNKELHDKRVSDNKRIWASMSIEEKLKRTKNGLIAAHKAAKEIVISKPEIKVAKQLNEIGIRFIQQKEILNGKYYLDFYIPSLKLVIECNGDYWHNLPERKQRDKELKKYVESTGRKIIFIWEHEINDDWFWVGDYIKEVI